MNPLASCVFVLMYFLDPPEIFSEEYCLYINLTIVELFAERRLLAAFNNKISSSTDELRVVDRFNY